MSDPVNDDVQSHEKIFMIIFHKLVSVMKMGRGGL